MEIPTVARGRATRRLLIPDRFPRTRLLLPLLIALAFPVLTGCSSYAKVREKRVIPRLAGGVTGIPAFVGGGIADAVEGDKESPEKLIGGFLESASASYAKLLKAPRDTTARDAYNFAVARVFSVLRESKADAWSEPLTVPAPGGDFVLTHRPEPRRAYHPSGYELTPTDQFDITGAYVHKHSIKEGIGATLVAVGKTDNRNARADYANARTYYGITAVARFSGRRCEMEFVDPLNTEEVRIGGQSVPLAADFTVPVAVMLAATNPKKMELARLLNPGKYTDTAHIARLQPYDPDKTVILVVHGLMDSPATWTPMLNELRAHREIRENYQFWFFSYPSGYAVPHSAAILRRELDGIGKRYRLKHRIVLIGHSMGGCISRLMITDSGMNLWNTFFSVPPEQSGMSGKSRRFFQEALIFRPRDEVGRVIFIAAPLRGADLARGWVGKLASRLVRAPAALLSAGQEGSRFLTLQNGAPPARRLPNSIDTLSPDNRFVKAVTALPLAPGIPFHSIMGNRGRGGNRDHVRPVSSDGVVPYWSSHLEGAVSELEVPCGHSAHHHPQAITEVLRILSESAEKR